MTTTRKTVYDINPEPEKTWFKIDSMIVCTQCNKSVNGYIILDRKNLQVVDTSGFMIFEDPICDTCADWEEE